MNLQERIEKMEKELAELKASVVVWPKVGEKYWVVNTEGRAIELDFNDDKFDAGCIDIGNIFRTKEEAVREIERRKVLNELRKLAKAALGAVKCDWKIEKEKWYVGYSHTSCEWFVSCTYRLESFGVVYFPTEETALAALETIGADRMMLLLED